MTANPLTPSEECEWRNEATNHDERIFATLDAARDRCAEVENVNLGLLRNIAALTAERDEARARGDKAICDRAALREQVHVLREALTKRDRLWCEALVGEDPRVIERVTGRVNLARTIAATEEKPVAEVGYGCTGCRSTPCICDKLTEEKP